MKVWVWRLTLLAAGVAVACGRATASQWIVLGTNGRVWDVDPGPFLPDVRRQRKEDEARRRLQEAQEREQRAKDEEQDRGLRVHGGNSEAEDRFFDDEEDESIVDVIQDASPQSKFTEQRTGVPDIETLPAIMETNHGVDWMDATDVAKDGKDRSHGEQEGISLSWPPSWMVDIAKVLDDDSGFPAVQGSVVFAELSCAFVAFIAYMVRAIPLWPSFSTGQNCCLFAAFGAATLYQFVVASWYMGRVSADVMLGLSSLITRMISLGMVPITTTSFLGRARIAAAAAAAAYDEQEALEKQRAVVASKPSRHRHSRARSN